MSGVRPRRSRASAPLWRVYPSLYDILWDSALTDEIADELIADLPLELPVEEVGAGTGLFTQRLLAAGLHVIASEPDERMAARLRRRLPHLPLLPASIADLPAPERRPCTVVAANVLHLSHDPAGALTALRQRAGQDGTVAVVTPAPNATVRGTALARRRAGDRRRSAFAFLACHVLLAPLVALGRSCVDHERLAVAIESLPRRCRDVRSVSRVVTLTGLTSRPPTAATS